MFPPNTRFLIVDDMMTMRKMVGKSLKEMGFSDFTEGSDGIVAFEKLQEANPPINVIVSDWNMPNCSGLDLLKRVRADSRFKAIPFVLVTAEAEKGQIVEAIQAGVSNYVIKPFTTDSLKEKLTAVYNKVYGQKAA